MDEGMNVFSLSLGGEMVLFLGLWEGKRYLWDPADKDF